MSEWAIIVHMMTLRHEHISHITGPLWEESPVAVGSLHNEPMELWCRSCHDDVMKWKLFCASLAICAGNWPVPVEFPTQRPVTQSFDVFFDLRLNKRLSKISWGWWFETPSRPLWRNRYATSGHWVMYVCCYEMCPIEHTHMVLSCCILFWVYYVEWMGWR